MRIALGADHRGSDFLNQLQQMLIREGHEVVVHGSIDGRVADYPVAAFEVGLSIHRGLCDRGVLICGSGVGMSIAANKIPGVRAAVVHDEFEAQMSRRHNDANVLCLSAHSLSRQNVDRLILAWLQTDFEGGRHTRRVERIVELEKTLLENGVEGIAALIDGHARTEPEHVSEDRC